MITTTVLICGTFLFGWLVACLQFSGLCPTCWGRELYKLGSKWPALIGGLSNFLITLKSIINPVIYAVRIPEIKDALKVIEKKLFAPCGYQPNRNGMNGAAISKSCHAAAVQQQQPLIKNEQHRPSLKVDFNGKSYDQCLAKDDDINESQF